MQDGVTIIIEKINLYMDYTTVDVQIKNDSKETICLDSKEDNQTTYIYDENGVRYTSFLNEISVEELKVIRNMLCKVNIRFNKMYNPQSRDLEGIVFKDVILNFDDYIENNSKKEKQRFEIKF